MNHTPIYITQDDHSKLRLLLATAFPTNAHDAVRNLREELDRAAVIDAGAIPAGVVSMNSTVEYEDLATNEVEKYTLVFPDRANVDRNRLSILAPIGTALLGCRVGDIVKWSTPGGIRQLRIREVTPPVPETTSVYSLPAAAFAASR